MGKRIDAKGIYKHPIYPAQVHKMASRSSEIEAKWQERWYSERINEPEVSSRPKFMIIFAYPGVTGYLHVGHMRGYTYVDAISRYKRMTGFNVLFPVGTHATGNGAISLANRVMSKDPATLNYLLSNGCPEEKIPNLETPMGVVDFFNDVYVNQYWKRFGFLADWRRFTCTLYPDYKKFIQWQFYKLNQKGLLIQKPYFAPACLECGPVAIDASETDLQKGGRAEINEYTLLKFKSGELTLIAATLRPETVYGQTNFWVNPDVDYVKVRRNDEIWVVSRPAYDKMKYQKDDLELIDAVPGRELVGLKCVAPVIHREILVLPARFCDPNVGSGLVTSVPSDAPDDWISLREVQADDALLREFGLDQNEVRSIEPIAIIDSKGFGPFPAAEIIEQMVIERSGDPRLEEAKKIVYKAGYHTGHMNENCGEFAGLRVEEAKERIREMMLEQDEAEMFYDLSEEVICRCGKPVVVKKVPDQWFIDYANPDLTRNSKEQAGRMHIMPNDYYSNVQGVLDWFRERACVRQGNWLGTTFPFDDKWIIEAISDSTLYPIYYLISRYANSGEVKEEQMSEEFFDFVLLGKGDVDQVANQTGVQVDLLERMRAEVEYWYPLDINLGGKEHMTVHFPAFLMNHVAILPEKHWPQGIFVNWYITGKLGKISKSKGGAEPIPDAAERFGVDPLRLYYAHIAAPFADVEFDEDAIENYRSRMDRIRRIIEELLSLPDGTETIIDRWLLSKTNSRMAFVAEGMKEYDLRMMANEVYFEMMNDLRWYTRRGGRNGNVAKKVLDIWVRLMTPITPHTAEELWSLMDNERLVSTESLPEINENDIFTDVEEAEEFLKDVMSDVKEILRVTGITPSRIFLYTSPEWKSKVFSMAVRMAIENEISIPKLTKMTMTDSDIRSKGKDAANFARKMAEDIAKRSDEDLRSLAVEFDEVDYLTSSRDFIESQLGCEVVIRPADEEGIHDPEGKAKVAQPRRPAIFVE
jgi:leucyl-tRNA synthetase